MKNHPACNLLVALLLTSAPGICADKKAKDKAAPASQAASTKKSASDKKSVSDKKPAAPAPESKPKEANDSNEVAAKVDGEIITRGEIEKVFLQIAKGNGVSPESLPAEQKTMIFRRLAEQMVDDRLVDKASKDIKVSDEDIAKELDRIRTEAGGSDEALTERLAKGGKDIATFKAELPKHMRERRWIEEQIKETAKDVTEEEAKDFYDKNPDRFQSPEMVRASHILFRLEKDAAEELVKTQSEKANAALERVKKGEDFGKLAEEVSEDPSAKGRGGDLDFFPREGRMDSAFSEEAYKLKVGEFSDMPLRTQFGLHIIKVTERKEAKKVEFAEVKERIIAGMSNQRKGPAVDKVVADLRAKSKVEILLPEPTPAPEAMPPQAAPPSGKPDNAPTIKQGPVEAVTPPVSAPEN